MKHTLKYLLLALIFAGCASNNDNVEQLIEKKADACKAADCTIKVADITSFKWDEMYAFNHPQPKQVIEKEIDMPYPDYQEGTRPLIFIYQNKIVHFENNPDGLTKDTKGQIIYNYQFALGCKLYKPQEAVFKVKVEKSGNKVFYNLLQ
ncbi:MAG: hypothetical protein ABIN91_19750 [Mucilaginibacter sp.]|uniref:hypothetical protein n=1 Tax=Mucilaginibacter sp. TaxID=1882438 RepID=UPI0032649390